LLTPEKDKIEHLIKCLSADRTSEENWASLYRLLWPFVVATIYRTFGGDRRGVEDLAQEVFFRLVKFCDFSAFPSPEAFLGFVHAVCKNVARDELRKRGTGEKYVNIDDTSIAKEPSEHDYVDRDIVLEKVFSGLDSEDRSLASYLLQGYTLSEVAERTKQSYGGLAVRFHRLRAKLKETGK
jgi:RNA polymerase sigma factor (sigma-70 family)